MTPVFTSPLWKNTAVAKVVSSESCMRTLPWFCSIGGSPPRDFTSTRPQYSPSAAPAGIATITRTTWRCPGWSTRRRGKTRRNDVSDGSPAGRVLDDVDAEHARVSETGYPKPIESSISSGREPVLISVSSAEGLREVM